MSIEMRAIVQCLKRGFQFLCILILMAGAIGGVIALVCLAAEKFQINPDKLVTTVIFSMIGIGFAWLILDRCAALKAEFYKLHGRWPKIGENLHNTSAVTDKK